MRWEPDANALKQPDYDCVAGVHALLTGLAWWEGRSRPQLSPRTAKTHCPSAPVPGWDWEHLPLLLQDGECCDSHRLWTRMLKRSVVGGSGKSATLQESIKIHHVCNVGAVKNQGSRNSAFDGVCDRLWLDRTIVRNLNRSIYSNCLIPKIISYRMISYKNHLYEKGWEKMSP